MDNRAIGVFDSGLGGLTAVTALRRLLPNENIVYLADTARVPYGDKSRDELLKCADGDISFLLSKNVKMILIACGTISSTLSKEQMESFPVKVVGVLEPAVKAAAEQTKNGKIGVIATAASIKSGAYKAKILQSAPDCEVYPVPCPKLVPLIESGETDGEQAKDALNEYLTPLKEQNIDTLILGCTHYPLLKKEISAFLPDAALVDVGAEAAKEAKAFLTQNDMLGEGGECEFFASGCPEDFKEKASRFLGYEIEKVIIAEL